LAVRDVARNETGPRGALVTTVEPAGPAAAAGVQPADLITLFGRSPVAGASELAELLAAAPVGQEIALTLWRDGETRTCRLVVARREAPRASALAERAGGGADLLTHPPRRR
jgi:serine protease Do